MKRSGMFGLVVMAVVGSIAMLTGCSGDQLAGRPQLAGEVRYFASYAADELPYRPRHRISEKKAAQRDTYCIAHYDDKGKLARLESYQDGRRLFADNYEYHPDGHLKRRNLQTADGGVSIQYYNEMGEPVY